MLALLALYWLRLGRGRGWFRRGGLGVDTAFCFLESYPSASVSFGGVGGLILGFHSSMVSAALADVPHKQSAVMIAKLRIIRNVSCDWKLYAAGATIKAYPEFFGTKQTC